ncbi:hypothetical protein Tco_1452744 [Tanacetum coccineum]
MISKVTNQPSTTEEDPQPTKHHSLPPEPSKPESPKLSSESPKPIKKPESSKRTRRRHKKPDASPEPSDYESSLTSSLAYLRESWPKPFRGSMSFFGSVQVALKEDPVLNAKFLEATEITLANMLREADNLGVTRLTEVIQSTINSLKAHHDTLTSSYKSLS